MMTPVNQIQRELQEILPYIESEYSVKKIGLFGSFVRNEQHTDSDLDILVSFTNTPTLFKFVKLKNFLSEKLNLNVDLVMETALKQNLKDIILNEVIPV